MTVRAFKKTRLQTRISEPLRLTLLRTKNNPLWVVRSTPTTSAISTSLLFRRLQLPRDSEHITDLGSVASNLSVRCYCSVLFAARMRSSAFAFIGLPAYVGMCILFPRPILRCPPKPFLFHPRLATDGPSSSQFRQSDLGADYLTYIRPSSFRSGTWAAHGYFRSIPYEHELRRMRLGIDGAPPSRPADFKS